MSVKPVQPLNAPSPMEVTTSEIVTDAKLVHPLNALSLIVVILFGISMATRQSAPAKAFSGIVSSQQYSIAHPLPIGPAVVKRVQLENTEVPIVFKELGKVMPIKPVQP